MGKHKTVERQVLRYAVVQVGHPWPITPWNLHPIHIKRSKDGQKLFVYWLDWEEE